MQPRTTPQSDIIRFWHSVELLSPQTVPKLTPSRAPGSIFVHEIQRGRDGTLVLPWSQDSAVAKRKAIPGKRWSHQIYGRCFDYGVIVERLKAQYEAENGYRETKESIVGLYALRFDDKGSSSLIPLCCRLRRGLPGGLVGRRTIGLQDSTRRRARPQNWLWRCSRGQSRLSCSNS